MITKEFLECEYSQNKKSIKRISQEFNIPRTTVEYWIDKHKIPTHPRSQNLLNMEGKRFGKLLVVKKVKNSSTTAAKWECLCDCGNIIETVSPSLRKGLTKSCGCDRIKRLWKGFNDLSGIYWSKIIRGSMIRNLTFNITKEYIWNKFIEQKETCSLSGVSIFLKNKLKQCTASLDRIDNSIGYEEGNVQWVHKEVNIMRGKMSVNKFFYWVKLIYEHNNLQSWEFKE